MSGTDLLSGSGLLLSDFAPFTCIFLPVKMCKTFGKRQLFVKSCRGVAPSRFLKTSLDETQVPGGSAHSGVSTDLRTEVCNRVLGYPRP